MPGGSHPPCELDLPGSEWGQVKEKAGAQAELGSRAVPDPKGPEKQPRESRPCAGRRAAARKAGHKAAWHGVLGLILIPLKSKAEVPLISMPDCQLSRLWEHDVVISPGAALPSAQGQQVKNTHRCRRSRDVRLGVGSKGQKCCVAGGLSSRGGWSTKLIDVGAWWKKQKTHTLFTINWQH
ncbi:unnamed protein product [Lepidochelys olivacea]